MQSYLRTLSHKRHLLALGPCVAALLLSGCGGGSSSTTAYTVGGTITGLTAGQSVTLLNNGGDGYVATADGAFTFATPLATGATYAVTVGTQPSNGTTQTQTCTVTNGSGTISSANVSNVSVSCLNYGYTTLYSFGNGSDGQNPASGIIMDASGNLYGTTAYGGAYGSGTVFKIDPSGNETVLYSFQNNGSDGQIPWGGLIQDASGNLYGATYSGGANNLGTVFKIDASGNETVLHSFNGSDGSHPWGGVIQDASGNLYGTTYSGGANNLGVVFKVDASGNETVLHSFVGGTGDGKNPYAGLVMDASGNLYGTTDYGGTNSYGTVFKIDTSGTETVLHSFAGGTSDGANPLAGLILDAGGNLYGTTSGGGANNNSGTVFKIDAGGNETILYSFNGSDGSNPYAPLVMDASGNLYGTTSLSQPVGNGTIFKLDTGGNMTVLYRFPIGVTPYFGGVVLDAGGNLYGTTAQGGPNGAGTVYRYIFP